MTRRGSNSVQMRQYNERVVLETLRRAGQASKAELARASNLTPQAVAGIVDALASAGLVEIRGKRFGRVGQPSILFGLAENGAFSIGLHIGRRSLDSVLVDFCGRTRAAHSHDYPHPAPDTIRRLAAENLRLLEDGLPTPQRERIIGIGIAMPYFVARWKTEIGIPEDAVAAWEAFSPKAVLATLTALPVFIENDASAAAAAELVYGVGRAYRNFLHLSINTLIGGGLVIDGNLETGPHGNTAAIGPMPVAPSRLSSVPSPSGPFELLLHRASAFVLINHLRSGGITIDRERDLDYLPDSAAPLVREWQEDCADALAQAIIGVVAVVDLDAVIIDGVLPRSILDATVSLVIRRFHEHLPEGLVAPTIVVGTIGARAPAIGAAILPVYAQFAADSAILVKNSGGE